MATTATEKVKYEKKRVEIFDTEENLAVELAKYTSDLSDKYCKERGAFTVVVSGGSLIKSLRKLIEVDSIDWSKWHFFWVDERVVPKHHEDSNYKLAYDAFLSKVPIPPENVYAINDSLTAAAAAEDYETSLKHLVETGVLRVSESTGFPKFDLVLLGMGPDGHVASLFPGHGLCDEKKRWVASITDSPKPPSERITFTFPVINSSAHVGLVVCGSGKAEAVEAALKKTGSVPAGCVSAEEKLVWFLDKPACSKLVILVSFLLFLPTFSSGLVETSNLDDIHYEVVTNKGRVDLEMDYENPHPRPPKMADPPPPNPYTKKRSVHLKEQS